MSHKYVLAYARFVFIRQASSVEIEILNERMKVRLLEEGPQGTFAQYVEWVLLDCGSHFSICKAEKEETTSPAPAMDTETDP